MRVPCLPVFVAFFFVSFVRKNYRLLLLHMDYNMKVRGLCEDKSNLEIMDAVGVYGDITDSVLAYNYYGHYSFGHEGGNIIDNEVKPAVPFACFCRRTPTDPFMIRFVFCVGSVFLVVVLRRAPNNFTISIKHLVVQ